jgi:5-formyltetrahydrofolate cyclo-ligase
MTKAQARTQAKAKRAALTDEKRAHLSLQLATVFFDLIDFSHLKVVHAFLPIAKHHEPDTTILLNRLHSKYPEIKITLPYLPDDSKEIIPIWWQPGIEMEIGKYNTLHPKNPAYASVDAVDLVLVPLLAYDAYGHRVRGGILRFVLGKMQAQYFENRCLFL